jgi:hypothetical protein
MLAAETHDAIAVAANMQAVRGRAGAIANCRKNINQDREPPMGRQFWREVLAILEPACDCGAENDVGKWKGVHDRGCAVLKSDVLLCGEPCRIAGKCIC